MIATATSASSEITYNAGRTRFREFLADKGLGADVFTHGAAVTGKVVLSFALHLRERKVHVGTLDPPRECPILGTYINGLISGLVNWLAEVHPAAAPHVRTPQLAAMIDAFTRQDIDIYRGPSDAHCNIPLGCEFVTRVLAALDTRLPHADTRVLYRALVIAEFAFGSRVHELIDQDATRAAPRRAPHTDRPVVNHVAKVRDLCFRVHVDNSTQIWVTADQLASTYADKRVSVVQLTLDHTKNKPSGTQPISVFFNPKGPDAPFCAVDALTHYARRFCTHRYRNAALFHGAQYDLLREVLRSVATSCGLNPTRVLVRGFRSGCCMATSPEVFADPGAIAAKVQQAYQGWADGGERPYAKGLMGVGQIKSLSLYDTTINTVDDMRARYMRFGEPVNQA